MLARSVCQALRVSANQPVICAVLSYALSRKHLHTHALVVAHAIYQHPVLGLSMSPSKLMPQTTASSRIRISSDIDSAAGF